LFLKNIDFIIIHVAFLSANNTISGGYNMPANYDDRRRAKRVNVKLNLSVSSLFLQDNEKISIDSPIEVKDISRTGLGFISRSILPLEYYFNAELNLGGEDKTLFCVVKIIRVEALEDEEYSYGCTFVGMAPVFDYIFDDLEKQ